MSDLINRKALMEHIEREYRQWGEEYDAEQILGDIEDFPTSFEVAEELKDKISELERWHTTKINEKIKNPFANTSTLICHNCDHKDEYIEKLESQIEEYEKIGTVDECRAAMEKQVAKEPQFHISEFQCPNCGMENLEEIDDLGHIYLRHKYCPDCGQALKWGE